MNDTKDLLALDRKYGRTITVADWQAIEKPASQLTDDDLVIISAFDGPERAAALRAQRTRALTPPAVATPAPAVTHDYTDTYAVALVEEVADVLVETVQALHSRNAEAEQRHKDLEARLMELELRKVMSDVDR